MLELTQYRCFVPIATTTTYIHTSIYQIQHQEKNAIYLAAIIKREEVLQPLQNINFFDVVSIFFYI